jgi:hypothetical protein
MIYYSQGESAMGNDKNQGNPTNPNKDKTDHTTTPGKSEGHHDQQRPGGGTSGGMKDTRYPGGSTTEKDKNW